MGISHISLPTGQKHFDEMRAFYLKTLAPLGYTVYFDKPGFMLGLKSPSGVPEFWLHPGNTEWETLEENVDLKTRPGRVHLAFDADSQDVVKQWYETALAAGGVSNGEPGLRPEFSTVYYGAFVLDPLGNNIEAVHFPVGDATANAV